MWIRINMGNLFGGVRPGNLSRRHPAQCLTRIQYPEHVSSTFMDLVSSITTAYGSYILDWPGFFFVDILVRWLLDIR